MDGEIIDAEYDADRGRIEYTFEMPNGERGEAVLTDRPWGPDAVLTDEAMQQLEELLPGTPIR